MSILRNVDKALKNVNKTLLNSSLNASEREQMLRQRDALMELKTYIQKGEWLRADAKEKFVRVLSSNFDYKKVAREYKTTPESIRVSISFALNRLEELIGKDIVNKILHGDIDEALKHFRTGTGTLQLCELIPKDVIKYLPSPEPDNLLTLNDCKAEVNLLAQLSIANLKKKLSAVDQNKLSYVLSLLKSNKEKDLLSKTSLIEFLEGRINWDAVINDTKQVSIFAEDAIFDQYVFNRLKKELYYAKQRLHNSRDNLSEEVEIKKIRALKAIDDYVKSLDWLTDDLSKLTKVEVFERLFETNYDYQTVAAERIVTIKQMENLIARESNQILEIIGHNTIDLIAAGQVDEGMHQFFIRSGLSQAAG